MQDELNRYLEAIKADYRAWMRPDQLETHISQTVKLDQISQFNAGLRIEEGKVYFKVIAGTGVHTFIVKEDGPKFRKGDILKAASWNAPAKNKARGNIFGTYQIKWTGANYL